MPVPIVDVVDVVAVLDGFVAAVRSVLVRMPLVGDVTLEAALVPVAFVRSVGVAFVKVVDMVAMPDRGVAAALAVLMRMVFVDFVCH